MNRERFNRAAIVAADWWADLWKVPETREQFRAEIVKQVMAELDNPQSKFKLGNDPEEPSIGLYVDYDPNGLMLKIVRACGVECSGSFFSARGLLPEKHLTVIRERSVQRKAGYANWLPDIHIEREAGS
jgi:hypothetical protein